MNSSNTHSFDEALRAEFEAVWNMKVANTEAVDDAVDPNSKQSAWVMWRAARQGSGDNASNSSPSYQERVQSWVLACFGEVIAADKAERSHRFFEEASELVQACGMAASEAHQLVDYTWSRPVGEKSQEVGGAMVTLAALCHAQGIDMLACGETELARVWTKVEKIRAKQAAKPKNSPLPAVVESSAPAAATTPVFTVSDAQIQEIFLRWQRQGGIAQAFFRAAALELLDAAQRNNAQTS